MRQSRIEAIGIEHLITLDNRVNMLFHEEVYLEALEFALLTTKKIDLLRLIEENEIIMEREKLSDILKLRMNIEENNYFAYF